MQIPLNGGQQLLLQTPDLNDPLTRFLHWFLERPIALITLQYPNALIAHASVVTLTLFRSSEFQVELVILLPGAAAWPGEHRHPDVDSYEVAMFNCVDFTKNGVTCNGPEMLVPVQVTNEGEPVIQHCMCVRLRPTDFHGTVPLKEGGCLLSVQRWLNGVVPTSVGKNWLGAPVTPGHAAILAQPDSKLVKIAG